MDAKKIFFLFVGLDRKHDCVSKHIILKTNIYELLQKNHKQMQYIWL